MKFNRVILATVVAVGLIGSVEAGTAPFCIAVGGGFGNGGTTFVARQFQIPVANQCSPWAGYTKTSSTVVLNTSGSACLSDDGHVLTVGVSSVNPNWTGGNMLRITSRFAWKESTARLPTAASKTSRSRATASTSDSSAEVRRRSSARRAC